MKTSKKLVVIVFLLLTVTVASVFANDGKIVVIGDDLSARAPNPWLKFMAAQNRHGEVVNATRRDWQSSEVWYVREVLEQYPQAQAYIILSSTNDLRKIANIEPEAVARIGARIGYMSDIIREKNPTANILLVVPPRVNPEKQSEFGEHAVILSELLAASIEKTARARNVHFISLLDTFSPAILGENIYPMQNDEQQKIAKLFWDELNHPVVNRREPVAAQVSVLAPPAAGMPIVDGQSADNLAFSIAEDLAKLPLVKNNSHKIMPLWREKLSPAPVANYVSNRDLADVVSEESRLLGLGVIEGVKQILAREMTWQTAMRMEEMFEETGADIYAQVNTLYAPDSLPAMISAIIPPENSGEMISGLMGSVVDWEKVAVAEHPAFNQVAINLINKPDQEKNARGKNVPALRVSDFTEFSLNPDEIAIPGLARFDEELVANASPVQEYTTVEVIRETPEIAQHLIDAPWNKSAITTVGKIASYEVVGDALANANYSSEEIMAMAASAAKIHAVNYPLPEIEENATGVDKLGKVRVEEILLGKKIIAVSEKSLPISRYVNQEHTMMPLSEKQRVSGYAVYVHTDL